MRYDKAPLSHFMWDVVFGTPQGLTGALFSVFCVVAGFVWAVSSPALPGLTLLRFGIGFFFYPLFLFFGLLGITFGFTLSREYEPQPSLVDTVIMAFLGLLPFVLPFLYEYCGEHPSSWACLLK